MDKRFMIILGLVIVGMISLFTFGGNNSSSSDSKFDGDPNQIQLNEAKLQGSASAPVKIIEFADFQCPGCAALFPALQQIKSEFPVDIQFAFRHFPLPPNIHPNAMAAHRAAEAARLQGKFWEMHDLLFQRQQLWSGSNNATQIFEGYAQEIGVDINQYRTDFISQAVLDSIQSDQEGGSRIGINSTPTLIINGQKIETPDSLDKLRQIVQDAINSAKTTAPSNQEATEGTN